MSALQKNIPSQTIMGNHFQAFGVMAIAGAAFLAASAKAQVPQSANYEQGVNAYFGGRSQQAEAFLSSAIEADPNDPRAYYFRAFSLLRQGRTNEALGDMQTGALLEAQQPHRFAIGAALELVQGPDRLKLEEFRRNARASAPGRLPTAVNPAVQVRGYREIDADVLRAQRIVPLEELLRPGGPRAIAAEPAAEPTITPPQGGLPTAKSPEQSAATSAQQPAAATAKEPAPGPVAETNPFGDDAEQTAPKAAPPVVPPQEAAKTAPPTVTPPQEAPKPEPPANPPAEVENPFGS
jgi:tetratricopeptide (TPR) repeat protein